MRQKLAARLASLWTNAAGRGIASVFVMKATIILLSFAVISLAARLLGPAEFGTYSIAFSAVGLMSTMAMLGQQVLLMRSWSQYVAANDPARLKGALLFGAAALALGIAVFGTAVYVWASFAYGWWLALSIVAYLVALTLVFTSAHLVRSAIGVGAGDGYGNILMGGAPVLYLLVCLLTGMSADLATSFFMFAAGALVAFGIHVVRIVRLVSRLFPGFATVAPRFEHGEWTMRSIKLWLSHTLESANQYLDVLVIGVLMSPDVAGAYFVITRLANAFATVADAMNMFSTRHIPDLYYRGEFKPLSQLLNAVAGVTLAITLAGMAGVLLLGAPVLSIFGTAFAEHYPALIILCIGTAALGAVGPSASILVFTGHEGRYLALMATSVAARIVGFALLVPAFGIVGAVIATAASFLLMATALAWSARAFTGIDGSVLRLFRSSGDAPVARTVPE